MSYGESILAYGFWRLWFLRLVILIIFILICTVIYARKDNLLTESLLLDKLFLIQLFVIYFKFFIWIFPFFELDIAIIIELKWIYHLLPVILILIEQLLFLFQKHDFLLELILKEISALTLLFNKLFQLSAFFLFLNFLSQDEKVLITFLFFRLLELLFLEWLVIKFLF